MTEERKVEAYLGEYASGKSEIALNRALDLAKKGEKVTLVDMDLVEARYCIRGIKSLLNSRGVDVVSLATKRTVKIDESGDSYSEDAKHVLEREGNIIFDVGYGARGLRLLQHVQGAENDPLLQLIMVINTNRKVTRGVQEIIEYSKRFWRLDGVLSNTNTGANTTEDVLLNGLHIAEDAADRLALPVVGVGVSRALFRDDAHLLTQITPEEIRWLRNWMPKSI